MALSGDTALVGALYDDGNGSAYVFIRSGTTWTQQTKFAASDGAAQDWFGGSVALSGDTALVGADGDDDARGSQCGSAYVFTRSGTTWTQQAKLTAHDGAAAYYFGSSVALSGDTALVGAYYDDGKGSAYVFTRSGTAWTQQAKLTAADGAATDWFGSAVALSGDIAIIGSERDDDNGSDSGSAYVYTRSGTAWTQQAKLTAADGATTDYFGTSVALFGDTALVGAYRDDDKGTDSGSAYVFSRSGTAWTQQAKLTAGDGAAYDNFGYSVALSGDTALVGAYGDDGNGSAYVFTRFGIAWNQQAKLIAADGAAGDYFGVSVALSGETALVGASGDDGPGTWGVPADGQGSAYVFTLIVPVPEIAVEQPAGTDIADGGSKSFGSVPVGANNSLTFTIKNTGSADLTDLGLTVDGPDADLFTVTATPTAPVGGPSGSTTFTVRFAPTSTGGKTAALHIASNDGDENPFDITLTGTGTAPEIAVEQPAGTDLADGGSKSFGAVPVGANSNLTFTIRNTGSADLTGLGLTVDGPDAALFTVTASPTAPVSGPGGSTTFTVQFAPTSTGGKTAALHIANNDSNENPFDITLTGTGTAPEIAVEQPAGTDIADGGSQSFGAVPVGANSNLTFTIKNTGSADLTGLGLTVDGPDAALFTVTASPTAPVSGPSGSTTFTVRFAPTSTGGKTAALHIASNDSDENPFDITLTGTGTAPEIAVEQPVGTDIADGGSKSFGAVPVGANSNLTFTIKNTGSADLTGLGLTVDGPDAALFTVTASPTAPVSGPSGSTTFSVRFAPTSTGEKTAALHIANNDGNENPFDITLAGTGTAPEIAVEQPAGTDLIDGTASIDFGIVLVGSGSAVKTFAITNSGSADLTGLAITKDGPDADDFTVGALGATTLAPGAGTTFTVQFAPAIAIGRTAALHIASNDSDENPFDIDLIGTGGMAITLDYRYDEITQTFLLPTNGTYASLPAITRPQHAFHGWFRTPTNSAADILNHVVNRIRATNVVEIALTTLYARWNPYFATRTTPISISVSSLAPYFPGDINQATPAEIEAYANGNAAATAYKVWELILLGLDPTDPAVQPATILAYITFNESGYAVVNRIPAAGIPSATVYKQWGKQNLTDPDWTDLGTQGAPCAPGIPYRFFKISGE